MYFKKYINKNFPVEVLYFLSPECAEKDGLGRHPNTHVTQALTVAHSLESCQKAQVARKQDHWDRGITLLQTKCLASIMLWQLKAWQGMPFKPRTQTLQQRMFSDKESWGFSPDLTSL